MNTHCEEVVLVYYSGEYHYVYDKEANGSKNLTYYSVCGLPILARLAHRVSKVPRMGMCPECHDEVYQK